MDKNRYENLLRSLDKDHMFGFGQQRILQSYIKDIQKELSDFTVLYEGNEIHLDSKKFANFKVKVKFDKKDNMKIFLLIALKIGDRITEYIPDMDLLRQMCINDKDIIVNSGNNLIENGVKIIFGEEFWNQLNEAPAEDVKEYESNEDQNLIVNNYLEAEYDEQNMDL